MSKKIIYFNPSALKYLKDDVSSNRNFVNLLKLQTFFQSNSGVIDRSETLKSPLSLSVKNKLVQFDPSFTLTYAECLMERMSYINQSFPDDYKFKLLYSGGIDSTAILAAFIDFYGLEKASKKLEIYCTPDSIDENPWLWDRYIRKNNFKIKTSLDHRYIWNDDSPVLMGEGNDHLFGGLGNGGWNKFMDDNDLYHPVTQDIIIRYLVWQRKSSVSEAKYAADQFLRIAEISPFPLENMYVFIWWYKFVLDWQAIMLRILSYANVDNFKNDVLDTKLIQFYNSESLQQWSIHFHKNHPTEFAESQHYKKICKDYITKVLHIPEYSNKSKYLSWPRVQSLTSTAAIIDDSFVIHKNPSAFLEFLA
jgi:hypothetical protein